MGGEGGTSAGMDRRTVLLVATLASFLTPFMGSAVNIALPRIGQEFEMDAVLLSWVATGYLLAAAMFLVPFGRRADLVGRKRVFLQGMVVFTVLSLAIALSFSGVMVVALRFLQGIGAAMIFGTGIALLTSVYPKGERGKVLGINVAAVYVGLSMGPFVGGVLTEHLGWRWVFAVNVLMGAAVIGLVLWKLRGEVAGARGERFDVVGAALYSLTITAVLLGFSTLPGPTGVGLLVAGVLGGFIFVFWGTWAKDPILDIRLFMHNRVFAFSNLAALINYSATFAVAFLLSLYLQFVKGMTPQEAGVVILVQPILQAAFSPLTGRLSDRMEPQLVASSGMAVTTLGLAVLVFVDLGTGLPLIVLALCLLGIGFALFSSPNTNAVMSSVGARNLGVASGTVGTMRLLGQVISMGIAALLFSLFIGRAQITPQVFGGFMDAVQVAFAVFTVMCFLGIFASMARGKLRG